MGGRTGWIIVWAMCVTMLSGVAAHALPIDYELAASGGDRPFADRRQVVPTLWSLFLNDSLSIAIGPPLDVFDADRVADLAEPGRGNPNHQTLGQIVKYGQPAQADRYLWLVIDRWAAVTSPRLMYFDAHSTERTPVYDPPPAQAVYEPHFSADLLPPDLGARRTPPVTPVPEPGTLALLGLGALGLMRYRK